METFQPSRSTFCQCCTNIVVSDGLICISMPHKIWMKCGILLPWTDTELYLPKTSSLHYELYFEIWFLAHREKFPQMNVSMCFGGEINGCGYIARQGVSKYIYPWHLPLFSKLGRPFNWPAFCILPRAMGDMGGGPLNCWIYLCVTLTEHSNSSICFVFIPMIYFAWAQMYFW